MAMTKKPAVRKPAVKRPTSKTLASPKINMPKKPTDKPSVKVNMAKKVAKKVKVEGPSDYRPNEIYKFPFTPAGQKAFGKLKMSPKTADTVFTLPKGAEKLSVVEKKQMQARRIADRKRTLARAANIIRRESTKPKIGGNQTTSKSTPKPKPKPKSKPKSTFGY
jgi:hypothetical protein